MRATGKYRKALFSGGYDAAVNPDFHRKDAKAQRERKGKQLEVKK